MSTFNDELWTRLVQDHDADHVGLAAPPRRRWPGAAILTASATALAATAVLVLIVSAATSTPPAYALTRHADGTATVTLNDLTRGIPALNARLANLGIR